MYRLPEVFERLINALSRLPGIGQKTAQRLAFHIMKSPKDEIHELSDALKQAKDSLKYCKECGNLTDREICSICTSDRRDSSIICVVENPQDIISIESSEEYKGLYHVLMGSLSPLDGIGPEDLRMDELVERVKKSQVKEVIIATDPNVEGEATASYIKEILEEYPVKVSQLAFGIPMGGNLEYADGITLGKAIQGRREF
ncbi:MAG: recombination mediator RecR [Elusimicrobiota bacterium]